MTEKWLPIPGYEHYEVSSEGRVRSLARLIHTRNGRTRHYDGQILTPIPNPKTGHLGVDLYRDGQGATSVRRAEMPIGLISSGERQPIGRNSGADGRSR